MTVLTLYWTTAALTTGYMLWMLRRQAVRLGSWRLVFEFIALMDQANGRDRGFAPPRSEEHARVLVYALALLGGLCWPATLVTLVRR